jgi:hypothetical protein
MNHLLDEALGWAPAPLAQLQCQRLASDSFAFLGEKLYHGGIFPLTLAENKLSQWSQCLVTIATAFPL